MTPVPPFADEAVARVFQAWPEEARQGLLALRELIFEVAAEEGVGPLQETLKWGQPAYLAARRQGSTLRLGRPKAGGYGIYAHCATTIIAEFREMHPDGFDIEGNRAVRFADGAKPPLDALRMLIRRALTYHRR
ncbi:DUF1801 domain-containing protein [Algicella marina]|uniref:DUF1801 domain-containing protein n=1 Tax=Algicella marina TaxID=2683284 RepID=A0A6P1T5J7_9RHOB|nr:DUF1801 domain-containing protein [Algicella marina]QHQ36726.1 DUF1801 domain-containing protein [Algicella marina]